MKKKKMNFFNIILKEKKTMDYIYSSNISSITR